MVAPSITFDRVVVFWFLLFFSLVFYLAGQSCRKEMTHKNAIGLSVECCVCDIIHKRFSNENAVQTNHLSLIRHCPNGLIVKIEAIDFASISLEVSKMICKTSTVCTSRLSANGDVIHSRTLCELNGHLLDLLPARNCFICF